MQKSKFKNQNFNTIYTVFVIFYLIIILVGSLPAIPLPNNQRLFVVSSGSMEPALHTGSVVITKQRDSYQVGDIITFSNPDKSRGEKQTTTHRVEKIINNNGEITYMTKGDANVFSDAEFIPADQVVGKVNRQIAFLGLLVNLIKSKLGLVVLVFIPGLVIVIKEIKNITLSFRARSRLTKSNLI